MLWFPKNVRIFLQKCPGTRFPGSRLFACLFNRLKSEVVFTTFCNSQLYNNWLTNILFHIIWTISKGFSDGFLIIFEQYIKYCYRQDLNNIWRLIGKYLNNISTIFFTIFRWYLSNIPVIYIQYMDKIVQMPSKYGSNIVKILSQTMFMYYPICR